MLSCIFPFSVFAPSILRRPKHPAFPAFHTSVADPTEPTEPTSVADPTDPTEPTEPTHVTDSAPPPTSVIQPMSVKPDELCFEIVSDKNEVCAEIDSFLKRFDTSVNPSINYAGNTFVMYEIYGYGFAELWNETRLGWLQAEMWYCGWKVTESYFVTFYRATDLDAILQKRRDRFLMVYNAKFLSQNKDGDHHIGMKIWEWLWGKMLAQNEKQGLESSGSGSGSSGSDGGGGSTSGLSSGCTGGRTGDGSGGGSGGEVGRLRR
jgi:hypothetical protein